ncbi:sulfotransferase 1E1-like [Amphiura filiformis]|uniref:sulfotransferase 1E1-like n=1 Tax=Amphiura filiformis TaxID=82378 RepID=UPI003B224B59
MLSGGTMANNEKCLEKWKNITVEEFTKLLAALPRIPSKPEDRERHEYHGYLFPKDMTPEVLDALKTWEVREDDVFLITFPKAGTTWMQEIVSIVLKDGNFDAIKNTHNWMRAPYMELTPVNHHSQLEQVPPSYMVVNNMASPRFIKSHLPAKLLPNQIYEKKPKIIYVTRNPKDLVVSYYHFTKYIPTIQKYETFGDCLEEFSVGRVGGGNWFTENLFWWNKRHDANVLFVKYEDMQKDLRSVVVQVCDFLQKPLSNAIIDQIVEHSSFTNMKRNPMSNPDSLKINDPNVDGKLSFMRKGKVGDWKNMLTVAQNEKFDELFRIKMAGSGLTFDFEI